ncbi:type II toxin-antitoxin system VapC family toxin [Brevibacterium album]|uniref:type II toxin-antitoxin system VapC family toxin n=1 Tax=Brevibacterium album TaxID=417948 RepID=UPI000415F5C7|nr:type II toxin-antitoxin system VapC family toxin [Brevibacterium album]
MIIDTSAMVAIIDREPEGPAFEQRLFAFDASGEGNAMSAAAYLEFGIVLERRRASALIRMAENLMDAGRIQLAPVTAAQARIARQAYRDYGKGMGHPAQLNFGDCFSYALAVERDEPLLFKGDDFARTDVRSAV